MFFNRLDFSKLSSSTKKSLKICVWISIILFFVFFIKKILIKYFISEYRNEKPWVHLTHPKIQDLPETYKATGHFVAFQSVELSPVTSGIVKKVKFKPGQFVHKGNELILLDRHIEYAQMNQQEAEYYLQEKLFDQMKQLFNKKAISKTQFLEAQAHFKKSKAIYREAYWRWKQKTILAPFDGIIGISSVYPGSYVSPGQTKITRLEQIDPLYIEFNIPETLYPYLKQGQEIIFSPSHHSKKSYKAKISHIEYFSETNAHTITVRANIKQPRKDKISFLPGEFSSVSFKIHSNTHVITIPSQAVIFSSKGTSVYIATRQKKLNTWLIKEQQVVTGLTNHQKTRIKIGLNMYDWIVDSGTQKIANGSFVQAKI